MNGWIGCVGGGGGNASGGWGGWLVGDTVYLASKFIFILL